MTPSSYGHDRFGPVLQRTLICTILCWALMIFMLFGLKWLEFKHQEMLKVSDLLIGTPSILARHRHHIVSNFFLSAPHPFLLFIDTTSFPPFVGSTSALHQIHAGALHRP